MSCRGARMSDFVSSQKVSPRMWALAALGALTIHLACVTLALDYLRDDHSDEDLGAPAIEIGIELLARRVEPTELPPGPDVEASAASPKVVETREVIEPSDLPHAVPVKTEDPERVVAPIETNKPEADEPNVPTTAAVPRTNRLQWKQPLCRPPKSSSSRPARWPLCKELERARSMYGRPGKRS